MYRQASRRDKPQPESLYHRAKSHWHHQNHIYLFTATLTNGLLLAQIVLSAALTGLGASDSSRVLITVFGALNTVIAGVVAFMKSRGQPVRARMFRDDLERVVDEIENSAVMWLGISRGIHGYSAIDTDEQVTVRSEVARLTRLYDRAVKTNTMNDPDMYAANVAGDFHVAALRGMKPGQIPAQILPAPANTSVPTADAPAAAAPAAQAPADPDESPVTKANAALQPTKSNDDAGKKSESKDDNKPDKSAKADDNDAVFHTNSDAAAGGASGIS